jgi:hypothetical protein
MRKRQHIKARGMVKLKDVLSPEANDALMKIQEFHKNVITFIESIRPEFIEFSNKIRLFINQPAVQHVVSVYTCKTLLHPVCIEILPHGFTEHDLKTNWLKIKESLHMRFPESLDNKSRRDRYNQIIECQTIGSYIAVCRSIYPEIESLLREEILLSDETWKDKWLSQDTLKKRQIFQSQQMSDLIKNNLSGFHLADPHAPLGEVGIFTAQFIWFLEKSFESFDPTNSEDHAGKGFRHMHAHGWAEKASFIDGLNGLLIFDLALQTVSELKEKKLERVKGIEPS